MPNTDLYRAIGIKYLWPAGADFRVGVNSLNQSVNCSRQDFGVRVEQKHELTLRQIKGLIVSTAEPSTLECLA